MSKTKKKPIGTYPAPRHGWTCFHCGETFIDEKKAREHFGETPDHLASCCLPWSRFSRSPH